MAVDKNFVVKNGLEVNSDLILADSTNKRVGIGSTLPDFTLDVIGGIGATDIFISGLSTFVGFSTFQDSIGVQKDITIAGISTVVGVATFRDNVFIDGDLNVAGDIDFDEISGRNLNITGFSTLVGFSTFKSDVFVAGVTTFVGVSTFHNDVHIGGNLNVTGDIVYDEVTGRNIKITGLSTFVGLSSFVSGVYINGITTTAGAGGITTTGGDLFVGDNLFVKGDADIAGVLTASSFSGSATIGLSSEGTFVGAGVSLINMASSNQTAIDVSPVSSGVATVTITPGVSLGLAIALGG
tara:strand:+ start:334 stop:1221 length:888 start_codon:yes stop_codon:yes gene_type:complete